MGNRLILQLLHGLVPTKKASKMRSEKKNKVLFIWSICRQFKAKNQYVKKNCGLGKCLLVPIKFFCRATNDIQAEFLYIPSSEENIARADFHENFLSRTLIVFLKPVLKLVFANCLVSEIHKKSLVPDR